MIRQLSRALAVAALVAAVPACLDDFPPPTEPSTVPLAIGESRTIDLRYLRFDVKSFAKRYTKQDLAKLPTDIKDRLWLLDLDLTGGPASPHLLEGSLAAIAGLDPATLTPAAANMQKLLTLTPSTANLAGTSLADLLALSPLLGLAPPRVLADMLQSNVDDPVLASSTLARVILENVIETHPNTRTRLGPRTADNPDGIYPVAPGTLPVTLADAASDFATLSSKFGEYEANGEYHPGFIVGDVSSKVLADDFAMTVRANANALPFKGVDLTTVAPASVNSIYSQIDRLFDFDDASWITFEGLAPGQPTIAQMTFRITEHPGFVAGGISELPAGRGDSDAWHLPPWTFERIVIDAARDQLQTLTSSTKYYLPNRTEPVFDAEVAGGWTSIAVTADLGNPPAPSYLWDTLLEVAQTRLHDGGIPEGEATVDFTLHDVPVGVDSQVIADTIRANLQADPRTLADIASTITANTFGDADFYYVRAPGPDAAAPGAGDEDWLFFVAPIDIPRDDGGTPLRPYAYRHPGFWADAALATKASAAATLVDGDTSHEKVAIAAGDSLFVEDDAGATYRVDVGNKPSTAHIALTVTRVR